MRALTTGFLWLVATIALALALPAMWVQTHLVDADGYAAFAQRAAADPALQRAVASELATQISELASAEVSPAVVGLVASSYTASPAFPGQFAQANRLAHRWMFTDSVQSDLDAQGRWVVDLAPMLADRSFRETLGQYGIEVPSTLPVPLTENAPAQLRPGQLQAVATWGPWVSTGLAALTVFAALLTVVTARRRGRAVAALGISALLVGAAGWASLEIGRRRVVDALVNVSGEVRQIADSMVGQAVSSAHQWLNTGLLAGVGLVLIGVLFAMIGGVGRRSVHTPRS